MRRGKESSRRRVSILEIVIVQGPEAEAVRVWALMEQSCH